MKLSGLFLCAMTILDPAAAIGSINLASLKTYTSEPVKIGPVYTETKSPFTDRETEQIKKYVYEYRQTKHTLPRELVWLVKQAAAGEASEAMNKFLLELPSDTQSKLAETLRGAGVGTKRGELALMSSKWRMERLTKLVEHILQADKVDEFKFKLAEELAEGFDFDKFTVEVEGQAVEIERVGNLVFMGHDMLIGEISDDDLLKSEDSDTAFKMFGFPLPGWFSEEIWKAILRLLQGNIDYWPVQPRGGGRTVAVPFRIASDMSGEKSNDVAAALARMCLETALPRPDYMEGENFARTLVTALAAGALKSGTHTCVQIIQALNNASGDNFGNRFILNLIPRTTHVSYINFRPHASRCSSPVGMNSSGPNNVNVADWCQIGSLMHETLHSLGFYHQQSRMDRDNHVDVLYENIVDDREHNYNKQSFLHGGTPYDYFSILHYSRINGFSIGGAPTMNATPFGVDPASPAYALLAATYNGAMGQRDGLSEHDIAALHGVY